MSELWGVCFDLGLPFTLFFFGSCALVGNMALFWGYHFLVFCVLVGLPWSFFTYFFFSGGVVYGIAH